MKMTLNMNDGRSKNFKSKTVIHEIMCVKNIFYPETIKNYNGAVATRIIFV